jgi:hypothetical protein
MRSILCLPLALLFLACDEKPKTQAVLGENKDTVVIDSLLEKGNDSAESAEFIITTAEQLIEFAKLVNDGHNFGKPVRLGADIMLNDTTNWQNWVNQPPANKWIPIGGEDNSFRELFDGNGHVISGIYINTTKNNQGLFGGIYGGTIEKLGVVASYIKGGTESYGYIGGLVGSCQDGTISDSYFIGTVEGHHSVGGLAGWNGCKINNSYSKGSVAGTGNNVGGLIGFNSGLAKEEEGYKVYVSISNSHSASTVKGKERVGGLVGWNNCTIVANSYSTGYVIGDSAVGKLVGKNNRFGLIDNGRSTGIARDKDGEVESVIGIDNPSELEHDEHPCS